MMNSFWPRKTERYFVKHKVCREFKAEAAHLYMEGLSLSVIGRKFGVSAEAVRKWIKKFEQAFATKDLSTAKNRSLILLDETKVRRDGKIVYASACLDLERREVISVRCTRSVSSLSTINIMEEALKLSKNKKPLAVTDHAPWYNYAFEYLKMDYAQITFGIRNYIERWYRTFKERTRRFYNNFPIRDERKATKRISSFLHLYAYWYNHMRFHQTLKCVPSALS
jgi:putative transposase